MKRFYNYIYVLLFSCSGFCLSAQPLNDKFAFAEQITIPLNGSATGIFQSVKLPVRAISKESGESFHPLLVSAGMDRKSAWYKFTISTTRNVRIELTQQDTMIPQNAMGLTVYERVNGMPNLGNLSKKLTSISKFGSTSNTCLHPGEYYIQVCARQNVTDTAWVNIEIKTSGAPAYDTRTSALDAGTISGTTNINLSVGCLSVGNTEEYLKAFGNDYQDYSQTAWVVFKSDNYTEVLNFSLQLNGIASKGKDSLLWGYRIYFGNAALNPTGLICIDSAVSFVPNFSLSRQVDSICHISPYSYYSVQFIFHKEDEYQLLMNIYESGVTTSLAPFPGNIPSSHKLGVLNNKVSVTSYDYFACNGLMPYNMCGTVAPAFIHDSIFQTRWLPGGVFDKYLARIDTFDLATWLTFILPADGLLGIDARWANYEIKKIKLFKGDVNLNCNIPLIAEQEGIDGDLCLKAGIYSLQLLGKSFKDRPSSVGSTQLGYKTTTKILFTQTAVQNAGVYDTITNPDDLGDITTSINSGGKTTQTYYVGGETDTVIIARDTIAGRFTFVQFHLSQPLPVRIECKVYTPFRFPTGHRLLRGKAMQILDTVAIIPTAFGQFGPSQSSSPIKSSCLNLDTGWYTIVGYHNLQPCETNTIGFSFKISRITYASAPKYNSPGIALKVNNGVPLSWASNTGTATYPKTRAVYTIGTHYFGCEADTPLPVTLKCTLNGLKPPMLYVNYYVFEIKNNQTYLKIRTVQTEPDRYDYHMQDYMLLRGDVSKDSGILNDTTRIVSSCESFVSYCNLNSGMYTLVKFKKNAGNTPIADMFYLDIDKRYESAFDYVANANELGLIPPDNTEKRSRPDFISCLTGADTNNPEMGAYIVQPKDAPNFLHADNIQKNVWYTFQVSGTGLITVNGYLYNYPNAYSPYRLYVYQSDDSSGLPFQQMVDSNFVDSTKQQGLKFIGQSQSNDITGGPPNLQFQKLGCATVRYYAMVANESQYRDMFQVELGIKFKGVNYPLAGDLCSTAIPMVANAPSTVSATALVNCHSIGESFGEDGSNLGCLGDKKNIKTTWFKYTYSGSEKVDMTFNITNLSNAPSALIHYRVLYGGCKSMTSGPCVDNANSSFKLDCMGAGDYYIQVSTPLETTGNIQLSAITVKTTYPVCKPFDLFMPFAYFLADGGCKGSSVSFINYSTQGNNIIYQWDFGNGIFSTEKTPSITFTQKYLTDTFNVKLVVTDTSLGKSDSIIIPIYIFYNQITLDAGNDTIVKCNYTNIQLHAATGYPTPVFEWNPAGKFDNPYSQNPKVLQVENLMLQLKMTAENCVLFDSLKMTIIAEDNIIGDSVLSCSSGPATLKVPSGYTNYLWSTGQTGSSIQVIKPDKYSVRMQKGSCIVYDTIDVSGKEPVLFDLGKDIMLCSGELVTLKAPFAKVIWSTGETDSSIVVNGTGKYWVKITSGDCVVYDSVMVDMNDLKVELGTDKWFCEADSLHLIPQITGIAKSYLWSNGSADSTITVRTPGKVKLVVTNMKCHSADSVNILMKPLPTVKLPGDTFYCNEEYLKLEPLNNGYSNYQWSTNETSSYILAKDSGVYWLCAGNNGCYGTDSIHVSRIAGTKPEIGIDTVFCGDFLIRLDGGAGISYNWSPSGEKERFVYVREYDTYILLRTDMNGCLAGDTIKITESCDPSVYVPNAFTPNKNGLNETFKAVLYDADEYQMLIYNRWGELVFETRNMDEGWDGTYEGRPVQQDVYAWIVYFKGKSKGSRKTLYGTVTLLR